MGNVTKKIYTENSDNEGENNIINKNYLLEIELKEQKKINEQLMEELYNKNKSFNIEITSLRYKINILNEKLKFYGETIN